MIEPSSPLGDTLARLRASDGVTRATIGEPGDGLGWQRLDLLISSGVEDVLTSSLRAGRRRDYAGATAAASVVDAVVSSTVPAVIAEHRLPAITAGDMFVRLHADGDWFEHVALRSDALYALADDRHAAHPTVAVLPDLTALHSRLAGLLVAVATPWFDAVRSRVPFGRRGMWGQLADDVCGSALWTARAGGLDERRAWGEAQAILDQIAATVPQLSVRPRLFPVRWSGGEECWQVKGTCCLWYTTAPNADLRGDGYCTTCPLREDEVIHDRLRAYLENEAAGAP